MNTVCISSKDRLWSRENRRFARWFILRLRISNAKLLSNIEKQTYRCEHDNYPTQRRKVSNQFDFLCIRTGLACEMQENRGRIPRVLAYCRGLRGFCACFVFVSTSGVCWEHMSK